MRYASGARLALIGGLALVVSACGDSADKAADTPKSGGPAQGDVLGGTISDEMIALDQVRSQSPAERIENLPESEGGKPPPKAEASDSGAAGEAGESSGEGASAPAASESGNPSPAADSSEDAGSASDSAAAGADEEG